MAATIKTTHRHLIFLFSHLLAQSHGKKINTQNKNIAKNAKNTKTMNSVHSLGRRVRPRPLKDRFRAPLPLDISKHIQGINALPTLQSPLPWLAMAKACLSLLRLSSSAIVCCRRSAAARAPCPSCASLSSRQSP